MTTTSQPLHFPGCHPGSGEYHQFFHRRIREGKCPRCARWLKDSANGCDLYNLHTVHNGTCVDQDCQECYGTDGFVARRDARRPRWATS